MRLKIDFFTTRTRVSVRSFLVLAAALVTLSASAWNTYSTLHQTQRANLHVTTPMLDRGSTKFTLSSAQADAINRAIRQLNLPWERLFAEVEKRLDNQLALLALEPDAANRVLRIYAETGSTTEMLAFVRALEESDFLSDVFLVRHEINEADYQPLRFVVEARWPVD